MLELWKFIDLLCALHLLDCIFIRWEVLLLYMNRNNINCNPLSQVSATYDLSSQIGRFEKLNPQQGSNFFMAILDRKLQCSFLGKGCEVSIRPHVQ